MIVSKCKLDIRSTIGGILHLLTTALAILPTGPLPTRSFDTQLSVSLIPISTSTIRLLQRNYAIWKVRLLVFEQYKRGVGDNGRCWHQLAIIYMSPYRQTQAMGTSIQDDTRRIMSL